MVSKKKVTKIFAVCADFEIDPASVVAFCHLYRKMQWHYWRMMLVAINSTPRKTRKIQQR
jgi:hypothetical protein